MSNEHEIQFRPPPVIVGFKDEVDRKPIGWGKIKESSSLLPDQRNSDEGVPDFVKILKIENRFTQSQDVRSRAFVVDSFLKTLMTERNNGSLSLFLEELKKEIGFKGTDNYSFFTSLYNFYLRESIRRKGLASRNTSRKSTFF